MDEKQEKLELFRIMVESSANNENKRIQLNNSYLYLSAALITIIASGIKVNSIIVSIMLLVVSILWICTLYTYRILSKSKFDVINEIEKEFSIPIFQKEWDYYKGYTDKFKFLELTIIERGLPIVIGIIALVVLIIKIKAAK